MPTVDDSELTPDHELILEHAGVKGMKWGVRNNRNPDYTDNQVKRDFQVYGRRGANRVNKALNKGDSISVARGAEKTRRDRVMGRNKYARQGGKITGALVGAAAGRAALYGVGRLATSRIGAKAVLKILGIKDMAGAQAVRSGLLATRALTQNLAVNAIVMGGAAKVASMMAGDAAVTINMISNGYDPSRK